MEKYIGVKLVEAEPEIKVINIDESNSISNDGYLVKYEDSYESWSPKDVFEKAYRKIKTLTVAKKTFEHDHEVRVAEEAKELNDKLQKLQEFITGNEFFKTLPSEEQAKLKQQLMAMQYYLTILIERIENF
jgi:hypothetical protein